LRSSASASDRVSPSLVEGVRFGPIRRLICVVPAHHLPFCSTRLARAAGAFACCEPPQVDEPHGRPGPLIDDRVDADRDVQGRWALAGR